MSTDQLDDDLTPIPHTANRPESKLTVMMTTATHEQASRMDSAVSIGMAAIRFFSAAGALFLVVTGCGGAAPAPAEPIAQQGASSPPPSSASAGPAAALPTSWSRDMATEQKVAFMKANVVPNLKPVFQSADATRYADFGCKTCPRLGVQEPA